MLQLLPLFSLIKNFIFIVYVYIKNIKILNSVILIWLLPYTNECEYQLKFFLGDKQSDYWYDPPPRVGSEVTDLMSSPSSSSLLAYP